MRWTTSLAVVAMFSCLCASSAAGQTPAFAKATAGKLPRGTVVNPVVGRRPDPLSRKAALEANTSERRQARRVLRFEIPWMVNREGEGTGVLGAWP